MGFPTIYDTTILNEHLILVILGPGTSFWVKQEMGRAGSTYFFDFLKTPFHGLSRVIWHDHTYWTPILGHFWAGQEVGWAGQNVFGLKTLP